MPIKRGGGDVSVGIPAPAWMLSFSDLTTQLLVFFVMLVSIGASLNKQQLKNIERRVKAYAVEQKIEAYVNTYIEDSFLRVSLSDRLMFQPGEADIASDEARTHIKNIAAIIQEYPNNVKIQGHTDPRPTRAGGKFATNWELSTARATNITRFILESLQFPPMRVASAGYAQYQPVAPNDSDEGMARNRRVDLVVEVLTLEQQKEARRKKGIEKQNFGASKPSAP